MECESLSHCPILQCFTRVVLVLVVVVVVVVVVGGLWAGGGGEYRPSEGYRLVLSVSCTLLCFVEAPPDCGCGGGGGEVNQKGVGR